MLTVEELRNEYGNLPQEFFDVLPDTCTECEFPLMISETLTTLHCPNPRCFDKVVMRAKAALTSEGVLFLGEAGLEKTIKHNNVTNPLALFLADDGEVLYDGAETLSAKVVPQLIKARQRPRKLWEYVALANLPGIQTSAQALFGGYTGVADAYSDFERGGYALIASKLGINEGASVRSMKVYETLMTFKEDLLEAEPYFNIVGTQEGLKVLQVVCSDQVGEPFTTKKEFYQYCKDNFGGRYDITFLPSVKKTIDVLVWAGADGSRARYTSKVKKVEAWQAGGSQIKLLSAGQFLEMLEKGEL